MMARTQTITLAMLLCLVSACAVPIDLPDGFVRLNDSGQGFRAVTSDDARVWVREMHDPTEGDVAFWAENLKNDFVGQRGYQLVDEGDVSNRVGQQGRWLELAANVRGQRVGYLVAVWVDGKWLQIVEFAAEYDVYQARVESVRAALATVRW